MSLPDPSSRRKRGPYLPFVVALVFIVAWSVGWLWLRGEAQAGLDRGVAMLKRAGYEVGWKDRTINGCPFRLNITLTEPRLRDPSGWAISAPRLEAQAYVHAPTSWI